MTRRRKRRGGRGRLDGGRDGGREREEARVLTSEMHHWINCWMGCCRTMRKLKSISHGCSLSTWIPRCLFNGSAFCPNTRHTVNTTSQQIFILVAVYLSTSGGGQRKLRHNWLNLSKFLACCVLFFVPEK